MKNKKDNQLSPEELLEWLNKHSSAPEDSSFSNSELNDLDEFEKEALEGFVNHTSPEKAQRLIEDINTEISKKIQQPSQTKRKTIIWFSSAASVVLIIALSIFLINKTKQETDSNIALNDAADKKETGPATSEKTVNEFSPENSKPVEPLNDIIIKGKEKSSISIQEKTETQKTSPDNNIAVASELKDLDHNLNTSSSQADNVKSIAGKKGDIADINQNTEGLASGATTKLSEAETKKTEADKDAVADEIAAVTAKEEVSNAYYEKAVLSKNKAYKAKEKSNADSKSVPSVAQNATMAEPTSPGYTNSANNQMAFYPKGDEALKNYILTNLKDKSLKGDFKVKATVTAQGILKTDKVEAIDKNNRINEGAIKAAINNMPQWSPATKNGNPVESKTSFTISL